LNLVRADRIHDGVSLNLVRDLGMTRLSGPWGLAPSATWTWVVSGDMPVTPYSCRGSAAMPAIGSTSLPTPTLARNSSSTCGRSS